MQSTQLSPDNSHPAKWHDAMAAVCFLWWCCFLQGSCPEDSLDAATVAHGYKWVPDALRITEANEPLLSLTCYNAAYWERHNADALRQVGCAKGLGWCGADRLWSAVWLGVVTWGGARWGGRNWCDVARLQSCLGVGKGGELCL